MKKISDFLSKNFLFLEVKISIYLNRRVFVMQSFLASGVINKYTMTICTNFQSKFNRRVRVKFEEKWSTGFRGEVQMCGRADGRATDGE